MRNTAAAITLVGAVVLGGAAGAGILKPGTARADAQKAAVTQRATDQVNGTFGGGMHGPGH